MTEDITPPSIVRLKRSSGAIEDDWTFETFVWSERRNTMMAKCYRLYDQIQPPPGPGDVKCVPMMDFIDLNPAWTIRTLQMFELIVKMRHEDEAMDHQP